MKSQRHFFLVFGPPAVGKMTVAYALAEQCDGKVFHNHMSIELLLPFFSFGSDSFTYLNTLIRKRMFQEVAKSDIPVFIFTLVLEPDTKEDREYVCSLYDVFAEHGWNCLFVELEATLEERIKRNRSEFRLAQKASKRDTEASTARLLAHEKNGIRFNTTDEFIFADRHLKINNTNLSAEKVAERICAHFNIPTVNKGITKE